MIKENYELLFALAEDTERFEDMRLYNKYCKNKELSPTERLSFYNCYKKILSSRRNVWHPTYVLEQKELSKEKVISWYRTRLESEMEEICKEVIEIADYQQKTTKSTENKAFFLKMKGDYHRYQAEYQCIPENNDTYSLAAIHNAFQAYESASEIALAEFPTVHPLRLSLALNFSVFFYEILKSSERALNIAKIAYQDGINDLSTLEGDFKKESEKLLALLNENITLWSSES